MKRKIGLESKTQEEYRITDISPNKNYRQVSHIPPFLTVFPTNVANIAL